MSYWPDNRGRRVVENPPAPVPSEPTTPPLRDVIVQVFATYYGLTIEGLGHGFDPLIDALESAERSADRGAVKSPTFAKCRGDVKHVIPSDYLCPECSIITEAEYVVGVIDDFRRDTDEAHARLQHRLEACTSRAPSTPTTTESDQ